MVRIWIHCGGRVTLFASGLEMRYQRMTPREGCCLDPTQLGYVNFAQLISYPRGHASDVTLTTLNTEDREVIA